MLFDDSEVLSADELKLFDSQALPIAQAEGVTLDGEAGLIRRVVDECGAFLLARANATSAWHTGRLGWAGTTNSTCGLRLNQIVVSGEGQMLWSPIRSWVAQRVLSAFYQTVQNSSKGEQYRKKAESFTSEAASRYWPILEQSGLPAVRHPLARPGAARTPQSGDWTLSVGAGTGPAGFYDIALTYVRQGDGAESAPSDLSRTSLQGQEGIIALLGSLQPPAGATHWNVYCGAADGRLRRQNDQPLPLSTTSFTFSPAPSGPIMGSGQVAEYQSPLPRLVSRG